MNEAQAEALSKLHKLWARFADAHRRGMDCLGRGAWDEFSDVVREERRLIEEQAALIKQLGDL